MVLHFFLKVVDQVLGLPQGVDQAVVDDQLADILKFLPDLFPRSGSPGLVFCLLFPDFLQLASIVGMYLFKLFFKLCHEAVFDLGYCFDKFFGGSGDVVIFLGGPLQEVEILLDLPVVVIIEIVSLRLLALGFFGFQQGNFPQLALLACLSCFFFLHLLVWESFVLWVEAESDLFSKIIFYLLVHMFPVFELAPQTANLPH